MIKFNSLNIIKFFFDFHGEIYFCKCIFRRHFFFKIARPLSLSAACVASQASRR